MKLKSILIIWVSLLVLTFCAAHYVIKHKNTHSDSGTLVSNGTVECTVYIIEKDGYRFAVAVGYNSCSITQIK